MKLGAQKGIGFDLAENQVRFANDIAKKMNLNCNFVATDILNIGSEYENIFDFIIITIGTLCWFHDLNHFFNKISKCLRKDGKVIINEVHPVTNMLGAPGEIGYDESRPNILIHSYFNKTWTENNGMRYITGKVYNSKTFTSFSHSLSFILNAMVNAGLSIRRMQEYDYDISDGTFSILNNKKIPLSYTLIAVK
jgi:SAM-dependent methyltransferase